MTQSRRTSRRHFLKTAASAAGFAFTPFVLPSGAPAPAPAQPGAARNHTGSSALAPLDQMHLDDGDISCSLQRNGKASLVNVFKKSAELVPGVKASVLAAVSTVMTRMGDAKLESPELSPLMGLWKTEIARIQASESFKALGPLSPPVAEVTAYALWLAERIPNEQDRDDPFAIARANRGPAPDHEVALIIEAHGELTGLGKGPSQAMDCGIG